MSIPDADALLAIYRIDGSDLEPIDEPHPDTTHGLTIR